MRNRKLFWHYGFLFIIIFLCFSILTVFTITKTRSSFLLQNKNLIRNAGELVLKCFPIKYLDDARLADSFAKNTASQSEFRITVILPDGTVIGDSDNDITLMNNHKDRPEIEEAVEYSTGSSIRQSPTQGIKFLYTAYAITDPADHSVAGILRIAVPIQNIFQIIRRLTISFSISGFIILLFLLLISLLSFKKIISSINKLKTAAGSFSEGDFLQKAEVDEPEELRTLGTAMNIMADKIRSQLDLITYQRNELETVLAGMTEIVVLLDAHLVVKTINHAGLKLLNKTAEEVTNRSLIELFRNSDLYEFASSVLETRQQQERSISIFSNYSEMDNGGEIFPGQGRQLFLSAHGTCVQIPGGRTRGVLLVFHDITKLKLLENMRKDFVANVSHELKTPITSIKGFVETLLDGAADDPASTHRFLGIIRKHADRLNSIIDDLLSLSRLEQYDEKELELERFSLGSIIQRAVQFCLEKAEGKNILISFEKEDFQVPVNARLIEQAIVNLIDNAVKYSDPDTTVTVSLKRFDEKFIEIAVHDQGCGIPPESIDRVFERFYRVDKTRSRNLGGTGLGLAIVKHITLSHRGEVKVQSILGKGSSFFIYLPDWKPV